VAPGIRSRGPGGVAITPTPKGYARRAAALTSDPRRSSRWARLGSNQRPPACEAGALPLSYAPGEVEDSAARSALGAGSAVMRIRAIALTAPTKTVMQPVSSAAFKPVE
jgi:hypothetical protein